nr:PREDICTED: uncharacterized protein LOC109036129 isoform X1 [Bemisia tabaci]
MFAEIIDSRFGSNLEDNTIPDNDGKELNGNNVKRMNPQDKRTKRGNKKSARHYDGNFVDINNMSQFTPSHWTMNHPHPQRQHLYPAMSDPSVCSYQIPISFPMESVSFPCYPVYQSPVIPEMRKQSHLSPRRLPSQSRIINNTHLRQSENYTSLPPVPPPEAPEDHQRRFSDPGLGNVDDSDLESSTCGSDDSVPLSNSKLMDQLTAVNNQVQRLSTQLFQTQSELDELKLDMVSVKNSLASKYEQPGLLSEMIGEIKKAAEIREKAFLSQISSFISSVNLKKFETSCHEESVNVSEKGDQPTVTSSEFEIDSSRKILEVEKKCVQLEQALSDAISAKIKAENEAERWKTKLISQKDKSSSQETASSEIDNDEKLIEDLSKVNLSTPKETQCILPSSKGDSCSFPDSHTRRKKEDFTKTHPDSTERLDSSPSTRILNSKNYSRLLSSGLEILDQLDDHALGPVTDL